MGRAESTPQKTIRSKRTICIICEGLTERKYMENFGITHRNVGRIEIEVRFPFEKEYFDRGQSDRMELTKMMYGSLMLRNEGKYTSYMYVTDYLHHHLDSILKEMDKEVRLERRKREEEKEIWDAINKVRSKVVESSHKYVENGFVTDFESIEQLIKKEIGNNYRLKSYRKKFDENCFDLRNPEAKTSIPDIDRHFVMFDRDFDSEHPNLRTDEEYLSIFKYCKSLKYTVLLSTPFFEFWLLMHHKEATIDDCLHTLREKDKILRRLKKYEQDGCKDWNQKLDKVKGISPDRFTKYYNVDGFNTAVRRSKTLPTDLEQLLIFAGTNIGVELEALLK